MATDRAGCDRCSSTNQRARGIEKLLALALGGAHVGQRAAQHVDRQVHDGIENDVALPIAEPVQIVLERQKLAAQEGGKAGRAQRRLDMPLRRDLEAERGLQVAAVERQVSDAVVVPFDEAGLRRIVGEELAGTGHGVVVAVVVAGTATALHDEPDIEFFRAAGGDVSPGAAARQRARFVVVNSTLRDISPRRRAEKATGCLPSGGSASKL